MFNTLLPIIHNEKCQEPYLITFIFKTHEINDTAIILLQSIHCFYQIIGTSHYVSAA